MRAATILAIDQGTTNTKALLIDADGHVLARASRPVRLVHPRPGWAEQSADELWASVAGVIADIRADGPSGDPAAIAISNQRETIVAWDGRTGQPVAPAISWQCRRSSDRCAALRNDGQEPFVLERTGLTLDALFPAAKLAWLLEHVPSARSLAREGTLKVGTVDSWLLWKLTAGQSHATDFGNASRTQLFNLETLAWDQELGQLFGVPLAVLPEVKPSDSRFGVTAPHVTVLGADIPIHAMMGDSHAALFGHGVRGPGPAKVTIGTGSSIMTATEHRVHSTNGLSTTIAWNRAGRCLFALEGNITVSGQAAAFARTLLNLPDEQALSLLAQTVDGSDGVVFVPALAGLGAPHWKDRARGMFCGMSLATRPAHLARATLEAIALQIGDVCEAMESDIGHALPEIPTDGGATRNDFLLQLLADLLDRPVVRQAHPEVGALGVAQMAAEAIGIAPQAAGQSEADRRFAPAMLPQSRSAIRSAWRDAVRRVSLDL